ncbi:hypothetical protein [Paraburkholderia nodosa]|uniref:hypothetical protein n=1 Tax=Paraburkholderia nodosa TaxID=392320 RepID=UPI0008414FCC|nr:hypothetical protein [Paraburkholderia nodosa]
MKTIYEAYPEYKEAFELNGKMRARINELNRREGALRAELENGKKSTSPVTAEELAMHVLNGGFSTSPADQEFEDLRAEHLRTKADMEVLQRGLFSHHETLGILRQRLSSRRMKEADVRKVAERAAKAAMELVAAQSAMRALCREIGTAGFESFEDALTVQFEPIVSADDSLTVYAKRVRTIAGVGVA